MESSSAAIGRCLKSETDAMRTFVALLREEQAALVNGDLERLASYAEPKAHILLELTKFSTERRGILGKHGLSQDKAGMERLMQEPGLATEQVAAEWNALLELTVTAQQANEINGTLIAVRLRGAQQALNTLFSAAQIPGIYRSDGSTAALRPTNSLGVA